VVSAETGAVAGLLHGSWIERQRGCGHKTCHCAQPCDPRRHSTYVYRQDEGKLRQIYVSEAQRETTRLWLDQDCELREILQELWKIHWQRVRAGEAKDGAQPGAPPRRAQTGRRRGRVARGHLAHVA